MTFRIPEPFQFNPLKHHFAFIRDFMTENEATAINSDLLRSISQIGTSVMDIYNGNLGITEILEEVSSFLKNEIHFSKEEFAAWTGTRFSDFRLHTLEDGSRWTLKFHDSSIRYVHLFPARLSPYTFRVKANTLKSALMYCICYGKDFITEDDLNSARAMINLSPVKEISETEAISGMIEILRNQQ
ncbi:MAG TPA: hypothetical protein VK207_05785 [Bacteroidales bacterium]|nr:hypothetical protein [Bacteroidales bacterium]